MYDDWGTSLGGYIRDMPKHHKRLFPNSYGRKRKLTVSIMKFSGIGVHYHVSIRQEDNPIIDKKARALRMCWDDEKGRGKSIRVKFNTPNEANNFVSKTIQEKFSDHEVRDNFGESHWYYREGD